MALSAHRSRTAASWLRRFLLWSAWPVLLAPATILLHELAHLTAALMLGFPEPVIHFSSIAHGDISDRPAWQAGVVGLAGPLVTIALILLGMAFSRNRKSVRWPYALTVSAASRLFVGVPYTVMNIAMLIVGGRLDPPSFDEYKAGVALGLPGNAVLGISGAFFFLALIWLAFTLPRGERLAAWPGLILGTVVGWAAWFMLIGPAILP